MHGLVSLRIQDTGYRIEDTGYRIQDTGYEIFKFFSREETDIGVLFTRRYRIQESYSLAEKGYRSPIH